ncbi:hypothetical protein M0R72_08330 [Candidatus Pacearchaeota archaeon]|jgi:hypothetical protein|nr:hypothetical protein [Candidatus Pacearchaeota archaeon]
MTFTDGRNVFHEFRHEDGTVYGCACEGAVENCDLCQWAGCPMRPENHISQLQEAKEVTTKSDL